MRSLSRGRAAICPAIASQRQRKLYVDFSRDSRDVPKGTDPFRRKQASKPVNEGI